MIEKAKQALNKTRCPGGKAKIRRDAAKRTLRTQKSSGRAVQKAGQKAGQTTRGSQTWIPFASYCTTGQFMDLENGYKRHCSPTAAVNVVRTLEKGLEKRQVPNESSDDMFLRFAGIGRRTRIYWNQHVLGHFGGTSNFLTGIFLRSCLRAEGFGKNVRVRIHPWTTADAVERALEEGAIILLQVYHHPKYKNHHMLCYACRRTDAGEREYLLADGWKPGPLWVDERALGHGHFLTINPA